MLVTLLLSLFLAPPQAQAPPSTRFTVYLSAPMRDGFADTSREVQDSIKDIAKRIDDMKDMQTVDRAEIADIVLTVVTRGVGSQAFGERLTYTRYYHSADVTTTPIVANTWWVSTVLEVGPYKKEFTGASTNQSSSSMGAWTECARQIANNLRAWALANSEQLLKRRKG